MARTAVFLAAAVATAASAPTSFYDLSAVDVDGHPFELSKLAGDVTVVINTATFWGFTAQDYGMLKDDQARYADQPVSFLLIPCNQFGAQEPKSNADIKKFAEQYVSFGEGSKVTMLAKSDLNNAPCGTAAADVCQPSSAECCPQNDELYDFLQGHPMDTVAWNFDKFVVDPSGKVVAHLHGGDAVDDAIAEANPAVVALFSIRSNNTSVPSGTELRLGAGNNMVTYAIGGGALLVVAGLFHEYRRRSASARQASAHNYLLMC